MQHTDVGSDYSLLVVKLILKLKKAKIGDSRNQRFVVAKLNEPAIRKDCCIALKNRFSILQVDAELTIDSFNQAMTEATKETVGYKKSVKS